ncbi:MAG: hypothetical protein J0I76_12245 [Thiobacillus sp.]|nr:hypothetical protein [Thiobacillus sp.]
MNETEIPSAYFPPVLNVLQLAELIHKTPQSVLADRSRAPYRLPPACEPPGTKSPLWLLDDVLAWLAAHRQQPAAAPAAVIDRRVGEPPRRRGRPTKAEQARRAAQAAQEGGE